MVIGPENVELPLLAQIEEEEGLIAQLLTVNVWNQNVEKRTYKE